MSDFARRSRERSLATTPGERFVDLVRQGTISRAEVEYIAFLGHRFAGEYLNWRKCTLSCSGYHEAPRIWCAHADWWLTQLLRTPDNIDQAIGVALYSSVRINPYIRRDGQVAGWGFRETLNALIVDWTRIPVRRLIPVLQNVHTAIAARYFRTHSHWHLYKEM